MFDPTSATDAARTVQAHGSRLDTIPATSACAPWCTRPHPDGFPVGYCESAPLVTWDKTPGDVHTMTAIRFVPGLADRVQAAEVIAVKGGDKPVLFTPDEARQAAGVFAAAGPGLGRDIARAYRLGATLVEAA